MRKVYLIGRTITRSLTFTLNRRQLSSNLRLMFPCESCDLFSSADSPMPLLHHVRHIVAVCRQHLGEQPDKSHTNWTDPPVTAISHTFHTGTGVTLQLQWKLTVRPVGQLQEQHDGQSEWARNGHNHPEPLKTSYEQVKSNQEPVRKSQEPLRTKQYQPGTS